MGMKPVGFQPVGLQPVGLQPVLTTMVSITWPLLLGKTELYWCVQRAMMLVLNNYNNISMFSITITINPGSQ